MNWRLLTSLALGIGAPQFDVGATSYAANSMAGVAFQHVQTIKASEPQPVSFTIDTRTVSDWGQLSVGDIFTQVGGETSGIAYVTVPTKANPIVFASLLGGELIEGGVAEDVLIYGEKTALAFSAENTAKALMIGQLAMFSLSLEEKILAYETFEDHPKFSQLASLFASYKTIPAHEPRIEEFGGLLSEILFETVALLEGSARDTITTQTAYQNLNVLGSVPKKLDTRL